MSVENNSLRTIDGLNTLSCDVINITESIEIDGDNGNNNQLLTSDGTRTLWADLSSLLARLTVSSPLSFVAGTFYDGSVARAIEIADGAIANVKLENSTISGKALGTNLDTLFFGYGLNAIDQHAVSATSYNGSEYIGFSVEPKSGGGITVDADGVSLTNDTISGVSLGSNLYNLNVSNPLSFSGSGPNNYDGSQTKTIQIANGAIDNQKLADSTISGISLGDDLADLQLYYGLEFLSGTTYNGSAGRTLNFKAKSGGGISVDGTGAYLTNTTISGVSLGDDLSDLQLYYGLEFLSGTTYNGSAGRTLNFKAKSGGGISVDGTGAYLTNTTISGVSLGSDLNDLTAGSGLEMNTGTTYNGDTAKTIHLKPEYHTISDRISYEGSNWLYTITATEWRPNDDSSFYNIHIEDDSTTTLGRAKISTTSLEAIAIIHIPYDWTPENIFIDCRGSTGLNISRTYYLYKIRNWGGTGSTYLGSYTTNSETAIDYSGTTYGAGESGYSLMIKMMLTATTDHLGGGYITLTAPSGDDY